MKRPWYQNFKRKRTERPGRTFDSNSEAYCFDFLSELVKAGEIKDLECQQTIHLVAGIRLRVDFKFFDLKLNETVYGEYKGFPTDEWRLKKKLWGVFGPGRLRIFTGTYPRYHIEELIPTGYQPDPKP